MGLPQWLVWYKKPEYRDINEYATAVGTGKRAISPDGRGKSVIPSRLSLERVLENKTCSPMSLYDFYMYLKHIEFSPENLEFYIWFKNYEARYAEWESSSIKETASSTTAARPASSNGSELSTDPELGKETLAHIEHLIGTAACTTTCKVSLTTRLKFLASPSSSSPSPSSPRPTESDLRAVTSAITSLFLTPSSPKELNIPSQVRADALDALSASPSPDALKPVADHAHALLRNCSHRNFVRLGVSNGTRETICVATALGIALTLAGFLFVLLRGVVGGRHSRFEVFGAWPFWWLGASLVMSGLRGSCFFLLLFTRRQPLPWERFDDAASVASSGVMRRVSRLMVFDRKVKVKDDNLRQLQHRIVVQSMVVGAVFASIWVLVFIFLPIWS